MHRRAGVTLDHRGQPECFIDLNFGGFWQLPRSAAPTRSRMAMDSSARESGMSVQEYALLGDRARADTLLSDRVSSGDQGGRFAQEVAKQ